MSESKQFAEKNFSHDQSLKMDDEILNLGIKTLETEAQMILEAQKKLDKRFILSVKLILSCGGRVVVTGIGKSAIIAQKIVATFNSTGTAAVYMHAADAIHGDLGIIQKKDVVICLSNSGNTPEIKVLAPLIKRLGNQLIAIVGNMGSSLALEADLVLNAGVEKEACPLNLAPTSSTAVQMAIGDALAICLLNCKKFSSEDFAFYHPGGILGKKLYLKAGDLAQKNAKPCVNPHSSIKEVILEISKGCLGATVVLKDNCISGVITDGDLRRMLENELLMNQCEAKDIMNASPKSIEAEALAVEALNIMQQNNISQLIVTDKGKYLGFIHMHDLVKEGLI